MRRIEPRGRMIRLECWLAGGGGSVGGSTGEKKSNCYVFYTAYLGIEKRGFL